MKLLKKPLAIILAVLAVLLIGGVALGRLGQRAHSSSEAVYYCPMHPTYTSDRPGDCPICNMRLVKREAAAAPAAGAAAPQHAASTNLAAICYLHNCAKAHDGKPCPMTVVAKPGEKVTCPVCGTHIAEAAEPPQEQKILYWTDPMLPGYRADGPGKSPMGMDLVPVYEEERPGPAAPAPEGYAPVLVTPQQRQLIGVTTAPAEVRPLEKTIRASGVIAHDPELYQAQAEYIEAARSARQAEASVAAPEIVDQARRLMDASHLRLRHLGLNDADIDEIGGWERPDDRLLLGGAGQYWVYASVYEYELPLVKPGQPATITSDSLPGQTFTGTVKTIDPMLSSETRTTRVRLLVDDPSGALKPGMYVNAAMAAGTGDALVIPKSAVFSTGERQLVFVDKGEGLFEPRQVTLGITAGDQVEVLSGIAAGEPVVTSGNFLIDSESRLRGSLQGAAGAHQHGAAETPAEPSEPSAGAHAH